MTRVGQSYGDNGIARVGLPNIHFRQNAIHGLGPGVLWTEPGQDWSNCTMFPHVIGIGASFNRQLFQAIGSATSDEARAFANVGRAGLDWFTPNINIYRDPRWGRGQETPGEDPYLSSEFAIQFVRGLQEGEDTRFIKTIADCKHYAGYDLEVAHHADSSSSSHHQLIAFSPSLPLICGLLLPSLPTALGNRPAASGGPLFLQRQHHGPGAGGVVPAALRGLRQQRPSGQRHVQLQRQHSTQPDRHSSRSNFRWLHLHLSADCVLRALPSAALC